MHNNQMVDNLEVDKKLATSKPCQRVKPAVDIYETVDEFVLLADLPGANGHGLQLEVEQGILTLEAQLAEQAESVSRSYYRQFKLSDQINTDAGDAILKDGVLTLKLPKVAEAKPKRIVVKTLH